jgi:hypothetical protein
LPPIPKINDPEDLAGISRIAFLSPKESSIEPNQIVAGFEHHFSTSDEAPGVKKKEIRF